MPGRSPVIHGICASQPRADEPAYAPGASGWAAKRSAAFDQASALSRVDPDHLGACVIYSLLWMNDVTRGQGNAASRMARLDSSTPEIISLHQQYMDRVEHSNQDPHNREDPLLQTARAHGVEPAGNSMAVDILTNEEAAMAEIAGILSRPGSSHLLWLGNLGSSNHAIAAHATDGRCILFDANLGEFRLRPSEVPMVMREIVARNSLNFAIPEILVMPMRT
ncbi:YopT-type cysteine protease domain-containing protein [Acidovorax sp. NCPPB 3859]|nr:MULTISPECIES: YopT-type cysteine protease domain-containing protein [unclassified Acidovorax]MDA8451864.1 YopT-type cysteine protease domain-containing protein [Acidovorax sp. GBBC 3297]MDA8461310.1 YopT-type cysteine protease domain-containing protein [Acidovorax sp. GBBC 3333]MDA8466343.1 YopT-type cysteine protease domain-containing protein [Acidovorax sp. GBBC 3332]MDA8471379.1 YopT-type cysteine protease domain-containing protein [Acidovorax sp. GBBC 3299]WCM83170.1 YopT-type cysteine 